MCGVCSMWCRRRIRREMNLQNVQHVGALGAEESSRIGEMCGTLWH